MTPRATLDATGASIILKFLQFLFCAKPAELFLYIWTLADKRSAYFRDLEEAADYVVGRVPETDVYVGVALTAEAFGPHQRINIAEGRRPAGIVAMWGDIDVAGPGHTKPNLPRDMHAARQILMPELRASMIVATGGGIQPWHKLKEPWLFSSDADIQAAALLAKRWNRCYSARAAALGYTVDSVHDLTRVLRVAGTLNRKIVGNPRPVTIEELDLAREYNPRDLAEWMDLLGVERVTIDEARPAINIPSDYDLGACAPRAKLTALLLNDPKFRLTWQHRRLDMPDQSPSSYDQATANALAEAAWTDSEIIAALIERRRIHGETNTTKYRASYFGPTISKARMTRGCA